MTAWRSSAVKPAWRGSEGPWRDEETVVFSIGLRLGVRWIGCNLSRHQQIGDDPHRGDQRRGKYQTNAEGRAPENDDPEARHAQQKGRSPVPPRDFRSL